MVDVVIDTTIFTPSGYSYVARKLVKGLYDEGIKVALIETKVDDIRLKLPIDEETLFKSLMEKEYSKEDTLLRYGTPMVYPKPPDHKRNILKFIFEAETLPQLWIRNMSFYDEYITITEFSKKSLEYGLKVMEVEFGDKVEKNFIDRPIHIVPHGVDTNIYYPDDNKIFKLHEDDKDKGFVFLAVSQWIGRKGFRELLDAYFRTFRRNDKTMLLLKTYGKDNSFKTMLHIQNSIKYYAYQMTKELGIKGKEMPKITVIGSMFSENNLRRLYNSADIHVLVSKGEGFGLPYLQSMACGVPSIAQKFGGHLSFMNDENSFLIEPKGKELGYGSVYGSVELATPDVDEISRIMKHVYDNRSKIKEKGKKALETAKQMTWKKSVKKLADIITSK